MLQLRNITKEYIVGEQIIGALQGLTVDFRKSEFVSVLGPSGCGKTTLMNIIGGLDRATAGELLINGKSTKNFTDGEWDNYRNKKIGFVFQSYNLIPHLSVIGNVELALTLSGISKTERRQRAKEALQEVGLEDRMNQRPNQLSGGQMQRVAIARALVNRPEILLADEPTGAIDTETSEQIMTLIKEIAKDRLVVMVTHNAEIAQKYSTRIIKMIDGKITEDSMPFDAESDIVFMQETEQQKAIAKLDKDSKIKKKKNQDKSAMSFLTALTLSGRNLITKKGRTILTAIAGSIGIIGIALILALSSGMNNYISQMQSDMLSATPITISATTIDPSKMDPTKIMAGINNEEKLEEFPNIQKILVEKAGNPMEFMGKENNITQEYIDYVKTELDPTWYNDIIFGTGLRVNFYGIKEGQTDYSKLGGSYFQLMLNSDFVNSQNDVLYGKYPASKNEVAIVVSSTNQITDKVLESLGLKSVGDDIKEYDFATIVGKEFKIAGNNLIYERVGSKYTEKSPIDIDFDSAETVTISAILRIKESATSGALSPGIGYTKELKDWLQEENGKSDIISFMRENPMTNPYEGVLYEDVSNSTKEKQRESSYRALGGEIKPNAINIYPVSYDTNASIKEVLDKFNVGKSSEDAIVYVDMADLMGNAITSIVNVITYVLIAFTAISLIVSSIMIGIITYVSVLERTKEIGILRSIGARKKDITRVFNAETFIIGLISGVIGVGTTYLLSIPLNLIAKSALSVNGIANLNPLHALLLIVISVGLTLISGFIPAKKAAKKDPVTALRTE